MDALLQAWHAYEATVDDPDPVARHDAHLAFHRAIWSASDNVLLDQLWPVIEAHMTIALAEDQRARPNPERSRRIHAALVDSIVARDPDRIEAALQAHTVATAEELIALCHQAGRPSRRENEFVKILVIGTGLVGGAAVVSPVRTRARRGRGVPFVVPGGGRHRPGRPSPHCSPRSAPSTPWSPPWERRRSSRWPSSTTTTSSRACWARRWPRSTSSSSAPRTSATAARSP